MSVQTVNAIETWADTGEIIPESVAREIASWWQSSGNVGRVLAMFASNGHVSMALQNDIIKTLQQAVKDGTTEDNQLELCAILAYSKRH